MRVNAQVLTHSVVSSGGGVSRGATVYLEWTLGEMAVESLFAGANWFTQGFHQPLLRIKEYSPAPSPTNPAAWLVKVSPNPVQTSLQVQFVKTPDPGSVISLMDLQGRRLLSRSVGSDAGTLYIDFQPYASGIYLLELLNGNGQVKQVYRVFKSN